MLVTFETDTVFLRCQFFLQSKRSLCDSRSSFYQEKRTESLRLSVRFSYATARGVHWNNYVSGFIVGEREKTIKYCFFEVMSPKQEEMKRGLPCAHFDNATARGVHWNNYVSGFIVGKSKTSLIEAESVRSITSRSIPKPRPPVGGIPYSRAVT